MTKNDIHIKHRSASTGYTISLTDRELEHVGAWARENLQKAARAVVVSNPTVFALYGEPVVRSLERAGLRTSSWLMNDGERYKTLSSVEAALKYFSSERLTRDDVVVALGGGVVGDLAGFASAVYLRGIRFLQIPTTLLAMIDSSVGGKTGVNTSAGKNLVGAFHRPSGVLIDVDTLRTLPRRELTAGFCEAIKQGAVSGKRLFGQIEAYLDRFPPRKAAMDPENLIKLISEQVRFKADIVRGDETETTGRTDARSRKILNFGHTFGHALEKVTAYRRFRHGEAVGYGMLMAGELSKSLDLLGQNELKSLYDVIHRAGRLPAIAGIGPQDIFEALKYDKKSTGETLNLVLLKGIGKPAIISEKDIPRTALKAAVNKILKS